MQAVSDDTRFASPRSYTPQHLAEKILTSRATFEGERKQVTVLFADIKGSMELLADRDAEAVQTLLFDPDTRYFYRFVAADGAVSPGGSAARISASTSSVGTPVDAGAHYRELAKRLRGMAAKCRLPNPQRELLSLARRYELRADHLNRRAARK